MTVALVALAFVVALLAAGSLRSRRVEDEVAAPADEPRPDGRLRFVLFRPAGRAWTIDATVYQGSDILGEEGAAVTLRLLRPGAPNVDVQVEDLLRRWAEEDRVVDVTLGPDATVTSLHVEGATMRLHLAS